jgi:2-iminobutanoate/2-iminopropanoate deaminase
MTTFRPVSTPSAPPAAGPYSQAIDTGRFVFVSGQLPVDPATGTIPDGAAAQAAQAFANLRAVLEAAGLGFADVAKTTVFLADLADFAAVNAEYARVFAPPFPARSCIQAAALPKGARLEIDAVAAYQTFAP